MTLYQDNITILHRQLRSTGKTNGRSKKFWPFGKNETSSNIGLNGLVLTRILNGIRLRIWRMPRTNSEITTPLILRNPARLTSYLTRFDNRKTTRKSTLIAKPKDRFFRRGEQYYERAFCILSACPQKLQFPNWQVSRAGLACGLGITLVVTTKMRNM